MIFTTVPRVLAAAAWFSYVGAQVTFQSTVAAPDGDTVIVSVSSDPVLGTVGVPIGTLTGVAPALSSAPATSAAVTPSATSAAVPTSTPVATVTSSTPRVVGQPGPTNADPGPTTYTYLTTDPNGNTVLLTDTYTPSYGVTTISTAAPAGTVMPYDQYTSLYGGGSGSGGNVVTGSASRQLARFGIGASIVVCILGGATLLL